MRRLAAYPRYVAIGFATVGFLLLFLAWNAAAELDHVAGQMPILISGGLTGLGLIAVGLTMAVTTEVRQTGEDIRRDLADLGAQLAAALPATATAPTSVPADGTHVVAGRSSFHLPGCRLISSRTDLQGMSTEVAVERGLTPCRVCNPDSAAS